MHWWDTGNFGFRGLFNIKTTDCSRIFTVILYDLEHKFIIKLSLIIWVFQQKKRIRTKFLSLLNQISKFRIFKKPPGLKSISRNRCHGGARSEWVHAAGSFIWYYPLTVFRPSHYLPLQQLSRYRLSAKEG